MKISEKHSAMQRGSMGTSASTPFLLKTKTKPI